MSRIDQIAVDLHALTAGIKTARTRALDADARAQAIAGRAAHAGFTGIAAGMSRVRDAIAEIHARLAGIDSLLKEAVPATAAVPQQTSPEQTLAALLPVLMTLADVRGRIMATIAKIDEAVQVAGAVLRAGQPGPMLAALQAIRHVLDLVAVRGDAVQQQVQAAVVEARHTGNAATPTADGGATNAPASEPVRVPPEQRWPGYPARRSLSWSDRRHIVYGDEDDPTSGGHLHGLNRPKKTEFPPGWDEDKIAQEVTSVADDPDRVARLPDSKWLAVGVREGVTIQAFVCPDGRIAAGHPVSGPGVKKNPAKGGS